MAEIHKLYDDVKSLSERTQAAVKKIDNAVVRINGAGYSIGEDLENVIKEAKNFELYIFRWTNHIGVFMTAPTVKNVIGFDLELCVQNTEFIEHIANQLEDTATEVEKIANEKNPSIDGKKAEVTGYDYPDGQDDDPQNDKKYDA